MRAFDPVTPDSPAGAPLLEVQDLQKHFPITKGLFLARQTGAVRAVDGVSFDVKPGETLALVGESGCGKSTTGRLILRLLEPTAGSIRFEGRDLTSLGSEEMRKTRRHLQIIFQDPYASLSPRLTVEEIIAEPLKVHGICASKTELRERVRELMRVVGLSPYHADRHPYQFSGGQRQRIGIARALGPEPRLIVADEPVSALDVSIQSQVVNLLQDLQERFAVAYVFIAHDLAVVKHIASRVAVMYLGALVEIADKTALFSAPHHPYTEALLSAVPIPDPRARARQERIILRGDVPSPSKVPPGCRFHTRCPIAQDICSREVPPLAEVAPGHRAACHFAKPYPIRSATN
jgi:oligopeptide transport system ATP-binding protein